VGFSTGTNPVLKTCPHFIAGNLRASSSSERLDVMNPATGEVLAEMPLATAAEVEEAVAAAQAAFPVWAETPVVERARVLFRYKQKLEEHRKELVELIVVDNGKTLAEAQGDVQRGIEVVEFATGIPSLMMGSAIEDIARGIDSEMFRQPLGVVAGFTPFNFPVMVPLWMIPIAVACGNTFILKPSERAPLASLRLAELFQECGAPPGVLNVVQGTRSVAEMLMAHPLVKAISVVGSSPVARHVYTTAAAHGKRVQALGGAKNALIVMPDADLRVGVESIVASAFGCAGQRCLAGSNVLGVGKAADRMLDELTAVAASLKLGPGLDPATKMGPVISDQAKERVLAYIDSGVKHGARVARDGRADRVREHPNGYFVGPTILDNVHSEMPVAREEIFGPVLTVMHVRDLNEAIETINASPFGNSASIYTTSGAAAREFRKRVEAGMLGVNLGVPAPMPFFPFSGWKGSFFGDLHTQGRDSVEFYTRRKVVTARW
jgi:malonate-semialdehyde dehydrogenase (acetylating)/methylmalonate-semialdehyde dehydrogenase